MTSAVGVTLLLVKRSFMFTFLFKLTPYFQLANNIKHAFCFILASSNTAGSRGGDCPGMWLSGVHLSGGDYTGVNVLPSFRSLLRISLLHFRQFHTCYTFTIHHFLRCSIPGWKLICFSDPSHYGLFELSRTVHVTGFRISRAQRF